METIYNREAIKYDTVVSMETIVCANCAIPFAVPQDFKANLQRTRDRFYCPNGHGQSYCKSTETILKERIERLEQEKQREVQRLKDQIQSKENQIISKTKENTVLKSKHTKFKNRVANGVCPCCNRSFENLHNHMKNEHPTFIIQ